MIVTEQVNGQRRITLPKKLCEAMNIRGGTKLKFLINNRGNLEIVRDSSGKI